MFLHNKRLQYTVRLAQPNPGLSNLLLEQYGGAQPSWPQPPNTSPMHWPKMMREGRIC